MSKHSNRSVAVLVPEQTIVSSKATDGFVLALIAPDRVGFFLVVEFDSYGYYGRVVINKNALGAGADIPSNTKRRDVQYFASPHS
jgi:hypothetical protein